MENADRGQRGPDTWEELLSEGSDCSASNIVRTFRHSRCTLHLLAAADRNVAACMRFVVLTTSCRSSYGGGGQSDRRLGWTWLAAAGALYALSARVPLL